MEEQRAILLVLGSSCLGKAKANFTFSLAIAG